MDNDKPQEMQVLVITVPENRLCDLACALFVAGKADSPSDAFIKAEHFLERIDYFIRKKADASKDANSNVTVDEQGRKHYTMNAECGEFSSEGQDIK